MIAIPTTIRKSALDKIRWEFKIPIIAPQISEIRKGTTLSQKTLEDSLFFSALAMVILIL